MKNIEKKVQEAVSYIKEQIKEFPPQYGIILGTGLGGLVDEIDIAHTIDYREIPHFPVSTVESHHGRLIFGELGSKEVVVMQGRFHFYEGYNMQEVTFPVRVMKLLGIETLFISNAAGGISPKLEMSDLMIIEDHINLLPSNPLIGPNIEAWGDRFPDMFEVYSNELIQLGHQTAEKLGFKAKEGVYASVPGPNLETRAEYKYLGIIGADAVGMSTVPEAIVATHMKLPTFAVSVITDLCYPGKLKKVNLPEILDAAKKAEPKLTALIKEMISSL